MLLSGSKPLPTDREPKLRRGEERRRGKERNIIMIVIRVAFPFRLETALPRLIKNGFSCSTNAISLKDKAKPENENRGKQKRGNKYSRGKSRSKALSQIRKKGLGAGATELFLLEL